MLFRSHGHMWKFDTTYGDRPKQFKIKFWALINVTLKKVAHELSFLDK